MAREAHWREDQGCKAQRPSWGLAGMDGPDQRRLLETNHGAVAVAAPDAATALSPPDLGSTLSSSNERGRSTLAPSLQHVALGCPPNASPCPAAADWAPPLAGSEPQPGLALPVPAEADDVLRDCTAFGRAVAGALRGEMLAGTLSKDLARWALITLCAAVRRRAWQAAGGEHAAIAAARVRSAARDASHEASRARSRMGEGSQPAGRTLPGGRKLTARGRAAHVGAARMIMVPAGPCTEDDTGDSAAHAGSTGASHSGARPRKRPRVAESTQWRPRVLPTNEDVIRVWASGELPEDGPACLSLPTKLAALRAAHRAADAVARRIQDNWHRRHRRGASFDEAGQAFSEATSGAVPLAAPSLRRQARPPSVLRLSADADFAAAPRAISGQAVVAKHTAGPSIEAGLLLSGKNVNLAGQNLGLASCRPAPPPPLRRWPSVSLSE